MQVTIPQLVLSRELALLAPAADRKATIPILGNVRIVADGDGVTLTATDLEHALVSRVPCAVREPGAICLPAKRLLDFVRSLTGESVDIAVGPNNHATVKCGKARARIPGESAASFPELPQAPAPLLTMDARKLAAQFERVAFAISTEEGRYSLPGLLAVFSGDRLECVATDGHRLALSSTDAFSLPPERFVVPKYAVSAFAKLADAAEGGAQVYVSVDHNHLFFAIGPRLLMARRIVGNFPDYERVLPKEYETRVTVESAALKRALDSVRQFGETRHVKGLDRTVSIKLTPGEIAVAASTVDTGECENSVECGYAGDEVKVGLDPDYITEFLSAAHSDTVEACIRDGKTAMEWRAAGSADYRYVLMPKRLNQ